MTSQVSLTVNKKTGAGSPWVHSFWEAVRENAVLTVINIVVFIAAIAVFNFIFLNDRAGTQQPNYLSLKYNLFASGLYYLLPVLLLESALLQGLRSFRFQFSRKASNAWFSIGISRNTLFWSRFASGAVGVLLPVLLAMLGTLALNLAYFSDVSLILSRFAYFTLGICLQAFVLYVLTVIVCTAASTIAEGIGYSVIFALLPSAVIMGFNGLMIRFLFGNSYGISDQMYYSFNPTLVKALADWNPLIFMSPYVDRLSGAPVQIDTAYMPYLNSLQPHSLNWVMLLVWAVASVAALWLARRLFLRRRVEKAGVLGTGKTVAAISVFTVAFFAFCIVFMLPINMTQSMPSGVMVAIAAAAAVAAMFAMAIPLKLLPRPIYKGLLPMGIGLAAMLTVVGLLASGGLGFSGYVPDGKDVASVTVSYGGLPLYLPRTSTGTNSSLDGEFVSQNDIMLSSPADVDILTKVHRGIVSTGPLTISAQGTSGANKVYNILMQINYTLKDGRTVTRAYRGLNAGLIKSMLVLDNAEAVKKAYENYITGKTENNSNDPGSIYASGNIYLSAPYYSNITRVQLDESKRAELLNCIVQDLTTQDINDRYFPDSPEVCTLVFSVSDENIDAGITSDFGMVYVTSHFQQTLAFLKSNNLMASVQQTREIDYLGVVDYHKMTHGFDYNNVLSFPVFYNGMSGAAAIDEYKKYNGLKLIITDPTQQQQIMAHAHDMYLASDGGYIVLIKYKGDDRTTSAFLPMKDAPDFVKQGVK